MLRYSSYALLWAVLLIIVTVSFSGCSDKKQSNKVTIEFMMFGSAGEIENLKTYIDEFEKRNQTINVEFIHVSKGYPQKLLTMTSGGVPPGCVRCEQRKFLFFCKQRGLTQYQRLYEG